MKIRFTPQARAELDEVLTHLVERSPRGAGRVQARIQATVALLADHPKSGRRTSNPRLRRILAAPYPYLIYYEVLGDEVVIIGLRHAARRPDSMPEAGTTP